MTRNSQGTQFFRGGVERDAVAAVIDTYLRRFEAAEEIRKGDASALARDYYTLATDFYEYGWGQSFHFAPRVRGETLRESLLRYEYWLASRLGLRPGMQVLDVGCGVGGPMRNIARFSGASFTGLTISRYQIERATRHTGKAGLEHLCRFVEGDFNAMPFRDSSFDAALEIEACCHAADRRGPFREAFRVLRPGGLFGGYDWCLTGGFDPGDPVQRGIKFGIEKGDGIAELRTTAELDAALRDAGFEILETEDRALTSDPETPWYVTLEAGFSVHGFRNSRLGAFLTHALVRGLEAVRLAPRGTVSTHAMLRIAQSALPEGGRRGIFTPCYFFLARKPG